MRISKITSINPKSKTGNNNIENNNNQIVSNPKTKYLLPSSCAPIKFGNKTTAIADLLEGAKEVCQTRTRQALLNWERETTSPSEIRLNEISKELGELKVLEQTQINSSLITQPLKRLKSRTKGLNDFEKALVREWGKASTKAQNVPPELVREKAELEIISASAWEKAREENNFSLFEPYLSKMVILTKKEAQYIDPNKKPLDTLLDYTGYSADDITKIFESLMERLTPITKEIIEKTNSQNEHLEQILAKPTDMSKWQEFSLAIAKDMGLDMSKVKLGKTAHSMMSEIDSPRQIGIAISEREGTVDGGIDVLTSFTHEAGHGLVELGASPKLYRTGLAGASLDMHESQSRLWENLVGKSEEFWQHYFPKLKHQVDELKNVSFDDFYKAMNIVKASPIRIMADEVTYNAHIALRHKLETKLFDPKNTDEDIEKIVHSLPKVWNNTMEKYLKYKPKSDSEGVLQDCHWSEGLFGYFPSYALGNLEGAQIMAAIKKEHPDLGSKIASGDLRTLSELLKTKIYQHGQTYNSAETMQRLTGKPLSPDDFIDYVKGKYLS